MGDGCEGVVGAAGGSERCGVLGSLPSIVTVMGSLSPIGVG